MKSGVVRTIKFQSQLLKGNPLRNRSTRNLFVYTPPGYSRKEKLPCIMYLPGFGSDSTGLLHQDFTYFRLIDLLIMTEQIPPIIFVGIDANTRLGGSQFLDSPVNGPYMSYIAKEVVPFLQAKFNIRDGIAITGFSSGGFGALSIASLYPSIFNQVASFAGDMHFELTHKNTLASLVNDIRSNRLADRLSKVLKARQMHYVLALCAAYSPNLKNKQWKVDFPIAIDSGEINQRIWQKWVALDPIEWIKPRRTALKQLDNIIISAGESDASQLHIGADTFIHRARKLKLCVTDLRYQHGHAVLHKQMEATLKLLLTD